MNRKKGLVVLFVCTLAACLVAGENDGAKRKLTLSDIFDSDQFDGKSISNIQWHADGEKFNFARMNESTGQVDIFEHTVKSGAERVIISGVELSYSGQPVNASGFTRTPDGEFYIIRGPETAIWRHSRKAGYFLYDTKNGALSQVAGGSTNLRNAKVSPDGKSVGYVRENNIYVQNLTTGEETAVTTAGTPDMLYGEFDWVYEEEFGLADAWQWAPDSRKIAFWQIDQRHVREFTLIDHLPIYNTSFKLKYPKAGEPNPIVRIGIADLESGATTWVDLGQDTDIYVPRIFWTRLSRELGVLRMNRRQNHVELLIANNETGATRKIIEDKSDTWLDVEEIVFLSNSNKVVWFSERSGYRHAYLYDLDGNLLRQITNGDWEVSAIAGINEKDGWLYFYGKKDSPLEQNVYRAKLDSDQMERISQRTGWHSGSFSPDFKHVVGFYSDVKTPTQAMLRKTDGTLVRFLEKNGIPALNQFNTVYPEFTTFTTTDGVDLSCYFIKPADFDPNRKYPVVVYGYGGPGSQMVLNRWGTGSRSYHYKQRILWQQLLTERGFLVFCLDNRGTGGRGKAFKDLAYGDLSKWTVNDHIEGAKYLRTLPFVDAQRIGFWGWSGGGYLSLMLMMRAADYFKVGISVAPVSDFHFYDTIWTERYMGLPEENAEGYKAANVLEYVDGLKGKLLLVHGTGDDNVHIQNAVHVVNALQQRAIPFDMMFYPNKNHRIAGGKTQLHLFGKMTEYFLSNL
jgi:dipeptidyl-peptidase-4